MMSLCSVLRSRPLRLAAAAAFSTAAPSRLAAIRPLARLPFDLPTGFAALPIPDAAFEKEQRLDQCMRSFFFLQGPEGSSLQTKPEIPLSLVNTWARKRLLRICIVDRESGKLVEMKEKPLAKRIERQSVVLVHQGLLNELRAGAPNTTLSAVSAGSGANGGAAAVDIDGAGSSPSTSAASTFIRAAPTMKTPSWVASCLRFPTAGPNAKAKKATRAPAAEEEQDFVVIAKSEGIATQGGSGVSDRLTVDFWLPAIQREVSVRGEEEESAPSLDLRLVHRLDKDVSGLMMLAKGRKAAEKLRQALAGRHGVSKQYLALVDAPLPRGVSLSGTIDRPVTISTDSARAGETSKIEALSEYHAFPLSSSSAATRTLLVLSPITGRKHQLRQHVLSLFKGNAGIAGDNKYRAASSFSSSSPRYARADGGYDRLMLHSFRLTIEKDLLSSRSREEEVAPGSLLTDTTAERAELLKDLKALAACSHEKHGAAARIERLSGGALRITDARLPSSFVSALTQLLA